MMLHARVAFIPYPAIELEAIGSPDMMGSFSKVFFAIPSARNSGADGQGAHRSLVSA
jgi:hypothetical protein